MGGWEIDPDIPDPIYSRFGSKTVVYKDKHSNKRKIVVTKDNKPLFNHLKDHRNAVTKKVRFFDGREGTKIAELDPLQLVMHPEWFEEPDSLLAYLDRHPENKVLPVGWTRQEVKRGKTSKKYKNKHVEIFGK